MSDFKSLKQLEQRFRSQEDCLVYYEAIRWAEGIFCPHCEGDTKIPLSYWFTAIYLATSHKKGISSHQLAKDLGCTQKTAWFVLHRVRNMLRDKEPVMLEGTVEVDETFIGGKSENKHSYKRVGKGGCNPDHIPVVGIVQRNGKFYKGENGLTNHLRIARA